MKMIQLFDARRAVGASFLAFSFFASVGCASVSRAPTDAFQAADIAIANAEKEEASEFAPNEMISARNKIAAAKAVVEKSQRESDVMRARRMADEARSDAEYASARARDGREQAVNADLQKNNDTLREELQRTSGGMQ